MSSLPRKDAGALEIRPATPSDAGDVAELLGVLGYPATAAEVRERLGRMDRLDWAVTLVAELEGRAVGIVTGHVLPSIHSTPPVAWLTTLVVNEALQGRGIGAQLTRAIEGWAREQGAVRLSLTSGLQRAGAHAFYERLGYERTGVRLTKSLQPGTPAYPVTNRPEKPSVR